MISGKPSSSLSISSTVPAGRGLATGDVDNLGPESPLDSFLSPWLVVLFLLALSRLCPSSSHPLLPKLPRRISASEGAFAAASPVAAHIPLGGLDSMNLRDAPRSRLPDAEAPELPRCLASLLEEVGGELWGSEVVGNSSKGELETTFVAILILLNNEQ